MRASREAAAESRERIIRETSRLMREKGVAGTSIADAMAAAGMTTGGFYKHFASKDELTAAAVRAAFDGLLSSFDRKAEARGTDAARQAYFKDYLSKGHIENPGLGCPVASLGADGGRQDDVLGPEFTRGVEGLVERLADDTTPEARATLIRKMSALIGAVVLARAVGSPGLKSEVLAAAKSLLDQPSLLK